ncbi:MAG: hypothetical protein NZ937_09690, partial [Armatimonadetes bacterium]|nr:hypothetical protein [Armatimonadota bacterium]
KIWRKLERRIKKLEELILKPGQSGIITRSVAIIDKEKKLLPMHIHMLQHLCHGLAVIDKNGEIRIELFVSPIDNDVVSVVLSDMNGVERIGLVVLPDGTPALQLFDKSKRKRAEITLLSDGQPALKFYDAKGKVILKLP